MGRVAVNSNTTLTASSEGPKKMIIHVQDEWAHLEELAKRIPWGDVHLTMSASQSHGDRVYLFDDGPLSDSEGDGKDIQGVADIPVLTIVVCYK